MTRVERPDEKKGFIPAGFTIVEVLVTSVILVFVLTAVFSSYVVLSQYVNNTTSQAALQSQARIALKKIENNIRLASLISSLPSGASITLTFNPAKMGQSGSSWTSRYRLVGSDILYARNIASGGEEVILGGVDLDQGMKLFEYDDVNGTVIIDLKVTNISIGTEYEQNSHLTTLVRVRNAY